MILSSAMLLDWLGSKRNDEKLLRAAELIDAAVTAAIHAGTATRDLGGTASTSSFTEAVIQAIR